MRSVSEIERAVSSSARSGASRRPATTHASAEAISSTVIRTSVGELDGLHHVVALGAQVRRDDEHPARRRPARADRHREVADGLRRRLDLAVLRLGQLRQARVLAAQVQAATDAARVLVEELRRRRTSRSSRPGRGRCAPRRAGRSPPGRPSNGSPVAGLIPDGEPAELLDLLLQRRVQAVVGAHDEHLVDRDHRHDGRERHQHHEARRGCACVRRRRCVVGEPCAGRNATAHG